MTIFGFGNALPYVKDMNCHGTHLSSWTILRCSKDDAECAFRWSIIQPLDKFMEISDNQ